MSKLFSKRFWVCFSLVLSVCMSATCFAEEVAYCELQDPAAPFPPTVTIYRKNGELKAKTWASVGEGSGSVFFDIVQMTTTTRGVRFSGEDSYYKLDLSVSSKVTGAIFPYEGILTVKRVQGGGSDWPYWGKTLVRCKLTLGD